MDHLFFYGTKALDFFFVKRILSNTLFHIWLKMEKKCNTLKFFPLNWTFFGTLAHCGFFQTYFLAWSTWPLHFRNAFAFTQSTYKPKGIFSAQSQKQFFEFHTTTCLYIYFLKGHYWKKLYRIRKYHDLQWLDFFFYSEFEKISINIRVFVTN